MKPGWQLDATTPDLNPLFLDTRRPRPGAAHHRQPPPAQPLDDDNQALPPNEGEGTT